MNRKEMSVPYVAYGTIRIGIKPDQLPGSAIAVVRTHAIGSVIFIRRRGHCHRFSVRLRQSERKMAMKQIILDAEAGQVSAELSRRGVASNARVHALVEVIDDSELPMGMLAQAGMGFNWLADEPDLYSDTDLVERVG